MLSARPPGRLPGIRKDTGQVSAEPTRRGILAGASSAVLLGSLLAGCKGIAALGPLPKPGEDVRTLDDAIAAEETMVARYRAAAGALSGTTALSATVLRLLGEHQQHLQALRSRLLLPHRLATASPRPTPTPTPPAGAPGVLADLEAAEHAASARLMGELLHVPPALAQLMASIAASEASHVVVLRQVRLG
jgi:hypothetical protein